MKKFKKIVLAYSGGLDTSVIIPVAQGDTTRAAKSSPCARPTSARARELDGLEEKALKTGASKLVHRRPEQGIRRGLHLPHPQGGREVRGRIPAGHLVCAPHHRQAHHRRLPSRRARTPSPTAAPARATIRCALNWPSRLSRRRCRSSPRGASGNSRAATTRIDYAEAHNIPLRISRETNYSKDKNLWHLSHEGLELEDPANEPQYAGNPRDGRHARSRRRTRPEYVTIDFEKGVPVAARRREDGRASALVWKAQRAGRQARRRHPRHRRKPPGRHEEPRRVRNARRHDPLHRARDARAALPGQEHPALRSSSMALEFADLVYNGQWYTAAARGADAAFVRPRRRRPSPARSSSSSTRATSPARA